MLAAADSELGNLAAFNVTNNLRVPESCIGFGNWSSLLAVESDNNMP